MNRPMVWVGLALFGGTLAGAWGWCPGAVLPASIAAVGILLPVFTRRYAGLAIVLAFFGAGALLWNARHLGPPGDPLSRFAVAQPESDVFTLEGRVERPDIFLSGDDYMQFLLRVDSVEHRGLRRELRGGVLVRWREPGFSLFSGDRVTIEGRLESEIGRVNWNTPGVEDFYRRRDVHTATRLRGPMAVARTADGASWSPFYWASRLRSAQAKRLAVIVQKPSLPFVLTVWLGDRRRIGSGAYQRFLESGTAHILAVSGVHMGIVFVMTAFVLRLLTNRIRVRTLITMGVVLIFALTAGARVSSMRAALMIVLYLLADLFEREPDPPTALSIAASLFLLHDPDTVFDAGFQLSFLSIASILLFSDPLEGLLRRLPTPFVRTGVATALSVQVLPLPSAVSFFHILSIVGLVTNVLIIPLLMVVLWLSFLTSACGALYAPLGALFGHALYPFVWLIEAIAGFSTRFGWGFWRIISPTPIAMACYWAAAGALIAVVYSPRGRRYWAGAAAAALAAALLLWRPLYTEPEITFLDVGHGDSAFIRTPEGAAILVDGGNRTSYFDVGERVVAPFLWSNHVGRLDAIFVSHSDSDHIGGLVYILERFAVGALYLGPYPSDSKLESEVLALCAARNVPVRRLEKGDKVEVRDARIETLHPPRGLSGKTPGNEKTLAFRLSWPGMTALFTGDIEADAEASMIAAGPEATLLKVPHHGSSTSSTAPFIQAVRPRYAVISIGRHMGRKVISPAVVRRYGLAGVQVFRTDYEGGIRASLGEGGLELAGARAARGYLIRR